MLTLFRNIRKRLLVSGQATKYLLYAVGEITLVVVGILIALQINNWNDYRKDRVVENKLLFELKENLDINLVRLKNEIQKEQQTIIAIDIVVEHLDNRRPYHDSMDTYFRQAFKGNDIVLSTSAFESIKSKGLEIIHTDSLRKDIIELFDVSYANLISETVRLEDQFWPSSVLPIIHKYFRFTGNIAKPVDYESLLNDQVYKNMLLHRRTFRERAIVLKTESLVQTQIIMDNSPCQ